MRAKDKMETVGKKVVLVPFKIPSRVLIRDYLYTLPPKKENVHLKLTVEMKKSTYYKKN
jgi:hypothetical protein